jgi:hypothetical protein
MKAHIPIALAAAALVLLERRCQRILTDAEQAQRDTRALVGEWQAEETAAVNREAGA